MENITWNPKTGERIEYNMQGVENDTSTLFYRLDRLAAS